MNLKALRRTENWFLLAAIILTLFVRFRHLDIALERDEGEYAYAAQAILRGELPYQDFYNMKLPAVYYSYAALFWLAGDSLRTVKIALILLNLLNAFLTFLIAKRLFGQSVGQYAAGLYLLFSTCWSAQGFTANAEHFLLVFALLGTCFGVRAYQNNRLGGATHLWLLASGLCMALAFLCKQHAFGYAIFIPILLFYTFFEKTNRANRLKMTPQYLSQILTYALGSLLIFGGFAWFIAAKNIYQPFHFFTVEYAQAYIGIETNPFQNIGHFGPIFGDAWLFWWLCFSTLFFALARPTLVSERLFLLLFFACSFACVCPGGYFRPHYFQLMFPAAAILAGFGLQHTLVFWENSFFKKLIFSKKTNAIEDNKQLSLELQLIENQRFASNSSFSSVQKWITIFGLVIVVAMSPRYFFTDSSKEVLQHHYVGAPFDACREIGAYIAQNTTDTATIGMVGDEPEIAFYARRRLASGFLYCYPLLEKQKFAPQMRQQFIREVSAKQPEVLVYFCNTEFDENLKYHNPELVNWFLTISKDYDLVGKLHNKGRYDMDLHWRSATDNLANDGNVNGYIFKKKR